MVTYEELGEFRHVWSHANKSPLFFHLTNACPMNDGVYEGCPHCYMDAVSPTSPDRIDMSFDGLKTAIEIFRPQNRNKRNMGVDTVDVRLSGGDPLIHSEFPKIVQYLKDEGCSIVVLTSGLPLIEKDANKDMGDSLRLLDKKDKIAISVDKYHSISEEEFRKIKLDLATDGCAVHVETNGFTEGYYSVIYPSKRSRKYSKLFDFESNYITSSGKETIKLFPNNPTFGNCESEALLGDLEFNPKGELLYCALKQNDSVCSIEELRDMGRDDALVYVAEKIYKKFHERYPLNNNCWTCLA